jgi:hypothetical protein
MAHISHGDTLLRINQYDILGRESKRKFIYVDLPPSVLVLSSIHAISSLKIALKKRLFTALSIFLDTLLSQLDIKNSLTC